MSPRPAAEIVLSILAALARNRSAFDARLCPDSRNNSSFSGALSRVFPIDPEPTRMTHLDSFDRAILALLQHDASRPNAEVAERVGLSASACLRRIQRLERDGVISGYVALLDAGQLGRGTTVFIEVTLSSQREDVLAAFETAAEACPDVLECHLMAGDYDYLLRVAVDGPQDYERLHKQALSRLPHVVRIKSGFALRTVVKRTAYPLPAAS